MRTFDALYIAGEWQKPSQASFVDVIDPSNERVVGRVVQAEVEHVDQAVRAARHALPSWKLTEPRERGRLLLRIAELMDAHADELAELIISELGSPAAMTRQYMVGFPANTLRFYGNLLLEGRFVFEEFPLRLIRHRLGKVTSHLERASRHEDQASVNGVLYKSPAKVRRRRRVPRQRQAR